MALDQHLLENVYRIATVDLGILRATPTRIVDDTYGQPLWGTSLTIWKLTGSCYIVLDDAGNDLVPFEPITWGNPPYWEHNYRGVWVQNIAQPGKTLVLYAGRVGVPT